MKALRELYGKCHRIDWHLYAAAAVYVGLGLTLIHRGLPEVGYGFLVKAFETIRQGKFDRKLGSYIPRTDPNRPHGVPPGIKAAMAQPATLGAAAVVIPDRDALPPVEGEK